MSPMETRLSPSPGFAISSEPATSYPTAELHRRVPSHRRQTLPSVLVVLGYILIGAVAFWPVFPLSDHPFGAGGDFALVLWLLAWVPHALGHGLNPLFSNAMYVPTGLNLGQNTASPLLGLITAPLAPVASPLVRANLVTVVAMPASATAAFVVLRKWDIWWPAAALGGLIYGFSPFLIGHSLGHLSLIFMPVPPFIALTVASVFRHMGSPRRLGVQLGLLLCAQYFISPEVLTSVAVLIVAAVACMAIRRPSKAAEMMRAVWYPVSIALAVMAVLLAYPIWMMLAGPQHITGPTFSTVNPYHNDLLSFVAPGPLQRVSLGMRSLGTRLATGSEVTEASGYIGIPLLVLTGFLAWRSRRSSRTQLAMALVVVAALLSLGPHLAVNGRLTGIPLPFLLLDHVPLVDNLLPSRFSFEMSACLAAVVAFGLDDLRRAPARRDHQHAAARTGLAGAAFVVITLAVLIGTQLPEWPNQFGVKPAVALPASLQRAIPPGDPVAITYPYATYLTSEAMLWQADDAFRFRLLGGYGYHTSTPDTGPSILSPSFMSPPELQQFLAGQDPPSSYGPTLPVTAELVKQTRTTLARYHVRLVIVDRSAPGSRPVMALFAAALGSQKTSAGPFSLWADWPDTTTGPTDTSFRGSVPGERRLVTGARS